MDRNSQGVTRSAWEQQRAEIERLWITQAQPLDKVIEQMRTLHGFEASVSSYKRQLSRWGLHKNLTRPMVFRWLQTLDHTNVDSDSADKQSTSSDEQSSQFERYLRRHRVARRCRWHVPLSNTIVTDQLYASRVLSPPLAAHAQFLSNVNDYIKRSCQLNVWTYPNHELLVESSTNQNVEKIALHNFINGIDIGRAMLRWNELASAFHYWRFASRQIDVLVHGSYHDILPNLLLKLCDLYDDGEFGVAQALIKHIADFCQYSKRQPRSPTHTSDIYEHFRNINVDDVPDLYESVMQEFVALFPTYFSVHAYNNHVMRNNLVRRRLRRYRQITVDHELPNITNMELNYGPYNRRSLDLLAIQAESALIRGSLLESDEIARSVIDRSHHLSNDHWLQQYYLFQGYYIRGYTMHEANCMSSAEQNLKACLHVWGVFRNLPFGEMFDAQGMDALKRLGDVLTAAGHLEEAGQYVMRWQTMLQQMQAADFEECSSRSQYSGGLISAHST